MKKNIVINIILGISSLIVLVSFILPIYNVIWILPGSNNSLNQVDNYYSLLQSIPELDYWLSTLLIALYILSVLSYTVLLVLRFLKYRISHKILIGLLIYPFLISLTTIIFFTFLGLIVSIAFLICIFLLISQTKILRRV